MIVALINVVMDGDYQYEQEIPLGLASIGAFLRNEGYRVVFHQCFASRGIQQIEPAAAVSADIYGFQLNMVNYVQTKAVIEKIKARNPRAIIICGGPFLVPLSERIMQNEPLVDFVVMGEGEMTTLALVQALVSDTKDLSGIEGLVWRNKEGTVIRNAPRSLIPDLDVLPFPARDLMEQAQHDPADRGLTESVRMSSSRGCIGRCSFCCVNLYNKVQKGKVWRGRSPKHVVDELESLVKTYDARIFNFSDSSFEDPGREGKKRSREICEEIVRRGLKVSLKIYMRCETMLEEEDLGLLRLYKKAGVDVIIVGAEAGSDYELKLYEKHATLDENYRIARRLNELDCFYVLVGFIMFGPNSTLDTLRSNMVYLQKFSFSDNLMLVANVLMLIRDSKLYHMLYDEGRVIDDPRRYWELPRYTFKDHRAERVAKHWQNLFSRYPDTLEINRLQVNLGNVIARMTNALNERILESLDQEYRDLKNQYRDLTRQFGTMQSEYFNAVLDMVRNDCSDQQLHVSGDEFFGRVYSRYVPVYNNLYDTFLRRVVDEGFGLSGLVFKHFHSAMAVKKVERIS